MALAVVIAGAAAAGDGMHMHPVTLMSVAVREFKSELTVAGIIVRDSP
jgi:hypothetical protein